MDGYTGMGKGSSLRRGAGTAVVLLAALLVSAPLTGCSRKFYRKQADKEVDAVLAQKDQYPQWKIEQYHVYPDPRARFADPTNPDRPPMPPDDPAAHDLSPNPQRPGKAGIATVEGKGYLDLLAEWNQQNRAEQGDREPTKIPGPIGLPEDDSPQSPATRRDPFVPRPDAGRPFRLKLDQAAELGLINSREFQDRREDLYLTALPVTLERFAFTAQFFATEQAIRERTGRETPEGARNRWRLNGEAGFTKLFSTGALLLFRFANQTVLELTGNRKHTISQSTALLELTQPLLRGGGKAVTLEPLTQVERNLLYEIRDYARFRKEFYVATAAGSEFGRAFSAFGGFGGVTLGIPFTAPTEGYLPVLFRAAQILNERKNVVAFEGFLKLFNRYSEGGDIGQVNVDQVEQSLQQSRLIVLQREVDYRDALDRFKLQLGVPTNLPLELDDTPLRPMVQQLQRFEEIIRQYDSARQTPMQLEQTEDRLVLLLTGAGIVSAAPAPLGILAGAATQELAEGLLASQLRGNLRRVATQSELVQGTRFRVTFPRRWAVWEKLTEDETKERTRQLSQERRKLIDMRAFLERDNQPLPPDLLPRLRDVESELFLGGFEQLLRRYESQRGRPQPGQGRVQFSDVVNAFGFILGDAREERRQLVRQRWPELPAVCLDDLDLLEADLEEAQDQVARAALLNRFDLMNQRGQLADSWRKIAVFANSLLGTLNIQYHLDSTTPPGQAKPLAFSGSRSRHQLILNGELPLVRQEERNNYRASLIGYQRARRALMAAEDQVVASVRAQIRQLRLLAENYRVQQRLVELAYTQVEQSVETFRQPLTPSGQPGAPPGGGGGAGNAAALTQQLVSAQRSLPQTQNQLFNIWINFQIARLLLYRDLELMPLDFRGVWTDEHATCCQRRDADQRGPRGGSADPEDRGREAGEPERLPQPRKRQPPAVQTKP